MGKEEVVYDQDLENRTLKIVEKIKSGRNRPCRDNIHHHLTRGGKDIEKEQVKLFLDELVCKGLLKNIGGNDPVSESYCTISDNQGDENLSTDVKVQNVNNTLSTKAESNHVKNTFVAIDNEVSVKTSIINDVNSTNSTSLSEQCKDRDFFKALMDCIKDEINTCVDAKLGNLNNEPKIKQSQDKQDRSVTESVEVISCYESSTLDGLRQEIEHLRSELKLRDNLIVNLKQGKDTDRQKQQKKTNDNKKTTIPSKSNDKPKKDGRKDEQVDNDGFKQQKQRSGQKNKRSITIIGDSILKDCKTHKMKHKLQPNERLYVKSFPGSTIEDMHDYVRPTLKRKPELMILHVGTNDLRGEKLAKDISSDIIKLAMEMKCDTNDVMISSLVSRGDKWNAKAIEVNGILKQECEKLNITFIEHKNIDPNKHLNGSKLHLNWKGTVAIASNFLEHIRI